MGKNAIKYSMLKINLNDVCTLFDMYDLGVNVLNKLTYNTELTF